MFSEYFSWLTAKIDSYLDSQLKQTTVLLAEHELIDWPVEGGAGRKPGQAVQETPSLLMGQAGG